MLIKSGKKVLNGGRLTAGVQAYDLLIIFILELIRHRLNPANLLIPVQIIAHNAPAWKLRVHGCFAPRGQQLRQRRVKFSGKPSFT